MRRRLIGVFLASILLATVTGSLPALADTRYNYVLPNGCQIDAWSTWAYLTNTASASTREDQNCEKIEVKMRWWDSNNQIWVLSSSGYLANATVTVTKATFLGFDYSDHNGRRNGSDWGFRLNGNI